MRGRGRLVVTGALLGVAGLVAPTALAVTVGLPAGDQIRLSGSDRYTTAVEVSEASFAPPLNVVFIATGENFPDALAAGPAAGDLEAPVLLVRQNSVPSAVVAELQRLSPIEIVVLGGPAVISDAVVSQLDGLAGLGGAMRISGVDRFETAAKLATDIFDPAATNTVLLATGANYPDALSGGPPGAIEGAPILLASATGVPDSTLDAMNALGITDVVFLGGTAALPESLKSQITSAVGPVGFKRLSGDDRYATSAAIVSEYFGPATDVAYLSVGTNFPDALAGAPSAAVNGAPILLSRKDCMPDATYDALQQLNVSKIVLLGGTSVLSDDAPTTMCAPPEPPACDPSYPTVCIPPPPPDLDCGDIQFRSFTVLQPDPHNFDGNNDGVGCES